MIAFDLMIHRHDPSTTDAQCDQVID